MRMIVKAIVIAFLAAAIMAIPDSEASETSAVSPDGKFQAFLQQVGSGDSEGNGSQTLILQNVKTGAKRRLIVARFSDDHTRNLTGLTTPIFSLDGGYLYITSSDASPYRSAVHQITLRTGSIRFVTGGWALSLIRTGKYRGYLLVQKHVIYDRPQGGTYNPLFVIRPDGHREIMIPNSANDDGELAVGPWLARNGWHAW